MSLELPQKYRAIIEKELEGKPLARATLFAAIAILFAKYEEDMACPQ